MDAEVQTASYDTKSVYGSGHGALYSFIPAVLEGKPAPVVMAREGRNTVELLVAAYSGQENLSIDSLRKKHDT